MNIYVSTTSNLLRPKWDSPRIKVLKSAYEVYKEAKKTVTGARGKTTSTTWFN
jgi:hypothetical protein